jgi:membrane protein YdbS with pleckstrin-like domain
MLAQKPMQTSHIIIISLGFGVAASLVFWALNGSIAWWHIAIIGTSLFATAIVLLIANKAPKKRVHRANSSKSTQ